MGTIVEATSLTHITNIATNPPSHPNTSVPTAQPPLILYIARVPGSRDVFLTPLKPREKVVSAEDVQSSLYYVHVNCHDDFAEPPSRPCPVNVEASDLLSVPANGISSKPALPARPAIPARPVAPPTPPYPVNDNLPLLQQRQPSNWNKISRKPVSMSNPHTGPQRQSNLPALPARPLPSPPVEDRLYQPSLHAENVRILRQSDHSEENNPYLRQYEPPSPSLDPSLLPEPGSLTLIRRDPSSNEQWDVASIYDPPVHEISSAALLSSSVAKRTKRGGAPLYLDISNPGYAQFDDAERPVSRNSTSSSNSSESDRVPKGVFRRRLYMPGSRYGEHSYGHQRKFSSVGSSEQSDHASLPRSMRHSVDMSTISSSPATDSRSKSYTFKSPWNGRCEFTTGTAGKSLKCKHHLPHNQHGTVQEVSELRFNLPTKSSKTATVLSEKRSSHFHRLHGRALSSENGNETPAFIIGEDGTLDLTLGRERAGGGFGGKQAKLGKLIIEPEGLKMLDLLVAANVGLWWRAYDRV